MIPRSLNLGKSRARERRLRDRKSQVPVDRHGGHDHGEEPR